jgi:hypothetical protein
VSRRASAYGRAGTRSHRQAEFQQLVFSPGSQQLLKRIEAPIYTRPPVTYSEEWVRSYVPNQSTYLTDAQRTLLHAQGKRSPIYGQAGTYIQKIYNRLLIDLS